MDIDNELADPLVGIGKMRLPKDRLLQVSYPVYKPSLFAQLLESERGRTVFAEAIEETPEESAVPRLSELCNIVLAQQFQNGNLDNRLASEDINFIGELFDVNMPLIQLVGLENEIFWKRVFIAKCSDMKRRCSKLHDIKTDFKKEAIEAKLAEVIESTTYELWDDINMNKLSEAVAPFVETLHITKFTPMKEAYNEGDHRLADFKITNYPERECHHGSLEMIGNLSNLTTLQIELLPPALGYNYDRRFFLFSYDDIENLAKGLSRLTSLKRLIFKRSRLDDKKMKSIVKKMLHLPLELIDFSYCELKNKCGFSIAKMIQHVHTLKSLELQGNHLSADALEPISYAIRSFQGTLEYLGLARNPISDDGVFTLGSGLLGTNQVTSLNLNGIEVSPLGAKNVVELLTIHPKLRSVEMCCIPLGEEGGQDLIEHLKGAKLLYHLEYRGCDLTLDQEFKVKLLINRNQYFQENPVLMDDVTTKEMEDIANKWATRVKHPILLNVKQLLKKSRSCREKRRLENVFSDIVPFFIHKNELDQKTNTGLLKTHFLEASGTDSEMRFFDEDRYKDEFLLKIKQDKFNYDPNLFNEKEIIRHISIGAIDDVRYCYFNPPRVVKKFI